MSRKVGARSGSVVTADFGITSRSSARAMWNDWTKAARTSAASARRSEVQAGTPGDAACKVQPEEALCSFETLLHAQKTPAGSTNLREYFMCIS